MLIGDAALRATYDAPAAWLDVTTSARCGASGRGCRWCSPCGQHDATTPSATPAWSRTCTKHSCAAATTRSPTSTRSRDRGRAWEIFDAGDARNVLPHARLLPGRPPARRPRRVRPPRTRGRRHRAPGHAEIRRRLGPGPCPVRLFGLQRDCVAGLFRVHLAGPHCGDRTSDAGTSRRIAEESSRSEPDRPTVETEADGRSRR